MHANISLGSDSHETTNPIHQKLNGTPQFAITIYINLYISCIFIWQAQLEQNILV